MGSGRVAVGFFRVKREESMCRAIRSFGMGAIEEALVHKYKTVSKTFNAKWH